MKHKLTSGSHSTLPPPLPVIIVTSSEATLLRGSRYSALRRLAVLCSCVTYQASALFCCDLGFCGMPFLHAYVCTLRIAKSVSRTRDIRCAEVWEIRKNKVGMHTQNTSVPDGMATVAAPSEWRHKRNMLDNHNLYSATYGKLSLFLVQD